MIHSPHTLGWIPTRYGSFCRLCWLADLLAVARLFRLPSLPILAFPGTRSLAATAFVRGVMMELRAKLAPGQMLLVSDCPQNR